MRIERIVITGDVFRTTNGDPNQIFNVRWLRGELSRLLYDLTGLWPDIRYRRNASDDGRALVAEWYGLLGHTPSVEAWVATYDQTAPPPALVDALRPDFDRALVIGFELSPLVRSILDRIGAPWIDIELSPIRFLDDLALNLRLSWPAQVAHPGLLSPEHVRQTVARLRVQHCKTAPAADCSGACIFLAQTPHDRTLIKDGGLFPEAEAIERVAQALDGRRLVLKPHPLAPDNPILGALERRFGACITDTNIYALLATAVDARFLTISSSAAVEAQHFGHSVEIFHAAADAGEEAVASLWAHRSAAFWRAALAPILPLKTDADFEEPAIPDRLRRCLGTWGFQRQSPALGVAQP
jgi:hypothetical protein